MSISLLFVLIIIVGICVYVFTKTVSNDASNDFKLRDILANSTEEERQKQIYKSEAVVKTEEATVESVYSKNIYEELANKQTQATDTNNYSTTTHETPNYEYKTETAQDNKETFYEKINDDACPENEDDTSIYEDYEYKTTPTMIKKSTKSISNYIKTFWRGITFTIGLLVSIYSFIGLAYNVQTSNDALIYSLWLLIGVILIK